MSPSNGIDIQLDQNGSLLFRMALPVENIFRYRSWESGFELERLEADKWETESVDYGLPLLNLAASAEPWEPIQAFVAAIPSGVRIDVKPYVHCQSLMLTWLRKSSDAKQLFDSAPNLFWLLVGFINEEYLDDDEVIQLLRQPRKVILSRILGVGICSTGLKILTKLTLDQRDRFEYKAVIAALRKCGQFRAITRLQEIPVHILIGAAHYPWLTECRAFYRFKKGEKVTAREFLHRLQCHVGFWNDALNVAAMIHIPDAQLALRECRDFESIRRLHDRWTDRLNQEEIVAVDGKTRFPAPPLSAGDQIFPIESFEDLQAEGRLMHHCVAGYYKQISRGRSYIYRILQPERATIEIDLDADQPKIRQIRLAYNKHPSSETRSVVYEWLNNELEHLRVLRREA